MFWRGPRPFLQLIYLFLCLVTKNTKTINGRFFYTVVIHFMAVEVHEYSVEFSPFPWSGIQTRMNRSKPFRTVIFSAPELNANRTELFEPWPEPNRKEFRFHTLQKGHRDFAFLVSPQRNRVLRGKHPSRVGCFTRILNTAVAIYIYILVRYVRTINVF